MDGGYTAVLYYLSTFMVGRPLWILALNSTVAFDQSCVFSLGVSCAMDILPSGAQTTILVQRKKFVVGALFDDVRFKRSSDHHP